MNKKKILGVILLSILFVLAGCSKKQISDIQSIELSNLERIEGTYNTDLGLLTISKDKKATGFEGSGQLYFNEDVQKFDESKLKDFFGRHAEKRDKLLKENEIIVAIYTGSIGDQKESIYQISWSDSDKTKKVDNITIKNTYISTSKFDKKSVSKVYSGVRMKNKE